jgi:hypothetical protein
MNGAEPSYRPVATLGAEERLVLRARDAQYVRDLLVREALDLAQQQHVTQRVGEGADRGVESRVLSGVIQSACRIVSGSNRGSALE